MSAGTKVYTFRLPEVLVERMADAIGRHNEQPTRVPWTWSDFVRLACEEKVRHMARSRKSRSGRSKKRRPNNEEADLPVTLEL